VRDATPTVARGVGDLDGTALSVEVGRTVAGKVGETGLSTTLCVGDSDGTGARVKVGSRDATVT